jgi:hypothetical protein
VNGIQKGLNQFHAKTSQFQWFDRGKLQIERMKTSEKGYAYFYIFETRWHRYCGQGRA